MSSTADVAFWRLREASHICSWKKKKKELQQHNDVRFILQVHLGLQPDLIQHALVSTAYFSWTKKYSSILHAANSHIKLQNLSNLIFFFNCNFFFFFHLRNSWAWIMWVYLSVCYQLKVISWVWLNNRLKVNRRITHLKELLPHTGTDEAVQENVAVWGLCTSPGSIFPLGKGPALQSWPRARFEVALPASDVLKYFFVFILVDSEKWLA